MIRRYHDFDPYTAVKPMTPGVFCKECGNREDNPNHRPPEPVIDWEARALAAEQALTEAHAETERLTVAAQEWEDECAEWAVQSRNERAEHGERRTELAAALRMHQVQYERANRIEAERDAARAELAALREAVTDLLHTEDAYRETKPAALDALRAALAAPVEPQPAERPT